MDIHFIDIDDNDRIVKIGKNIFIPNKGDLVDLEGIEYMVNGRNINYDKNIIEIYIEDG